MTKVGGCTKYSAAKQIDESRRPADRSIDQMQHHVVTASKIPIAFWGEAGPMEAFGAARKAGRIRFIGFTGDKDPHVHWYMLEVERHGFHFDTVQMPHRGRQREGTRARADRCAHVSPYD
jgi:aryl-alcohol dehydrogenase-like predicted oxidoreductase